MFQSKLRSGSAERARPVAPGLLGAVALLAVVVSPGLAVAQRTYLKPAVTLIQEYDSNALSREDSDGSPVTRVDAEVSAQREGRYGNAGIEVGVNSRTVWEYSELNSVDPRASYFARGLVNPRLRVFSSGYWRRYTNLDELVVDGETLRGGRPDRDQWSLTGGLNYSLSPRATLSWSVDHQQVEYDQSDTSIGDRFDRKTYATTGSASYVITPRDTGQIRVSYSQNEFSRFVVENLDQDMYTATAIWERQWTPYLHTTIVGGFTRVESSQGNLPESSDETFVGGITIERETSRSRANLTYDRVVRPSTGSRAEELVETIAGEFSYQLTRDLEAFFLASWRRFQEDERVTLQEIFPGLFFPLTRRDAEIRNTLVEATLNWRVGRRSLTFFTLQYFDRGSYGAREELEYDRFRAQIGFRYSFDQLI